MIELETLTTDQLNALPDLIAAEKARRERREWEPWRDALNAWYMREGAATPMDSGDKQNVERFRRSIPHLPPRELLANPHVKAAVDLLLRIRATGGVPLDDIKAALAPFGDSK